MSDPNIGLLYDAIRQMSDSAHRAGCVEISTLILCDQIARFPAMPVTVATRAQRKALDELRVTADRVRATLERKV